MTIGAEKTSLWAKEAAVANGSNPMSKGQEEKT